ncbi:MAG: low molecular weight phosphotyrosine protein phosphatase [Alphaproteobacteria bacterium]|nr:low molecular weight phosphotyrosine protein phosphatase [Alphaproteobacteria bacterium]
MSKPRSLLFVCTGNICRSPVAEGYMRHILKELGMLEQFTLDSAGVDSHHIDQAPDPRAQSTSLKYGVDISDLRARNIRGRDFDNFDLILAMDKTHFARLKKHAPEGCKARIELYLPYSESTPVMEVPDPYYGDLSDFEYVHALLLRATEGILKKIL